jgi:3-phenylpropionate/cinnamic acid dioxygenase small subunit
MKPGVSTWIFESFLDEDIMPANPEYSREIDEINYAVAYIGAALDKGEYDSWLSYFLPDAPYTAITAANLAEDGPSLFFDFGVDGRKERVAFWLGMWQVGRSRIRHLVGRSLLIGQENATWKIATPFFVSRTGDDGITALHVSAVYNDDWVSTPDGWRLAWRRVVIDCDVLPSNFTDPL